MPILLTEQVDLSEATIDHDGRVLKNVVLIRAGTSLNRRHYSEAVLAKAAPSFDGVPAFDSHDSRARKVAEMTGWYKNPRFVEGKLYADRYFSGTQAGRDMQAIAEDIVNGVAPRTLAGLSINAVGTGKQQKLSDGDALVIESITKVTSVDDVTSPAAGGSYTEAAKAGDELAVALIEAMTYEEFLAARPDFTERLRKEIKAVRQEDALKTGLAEADQKVKAAETEAEQATRALADAQQTIETLTQARESAVQEAATARRALAVEQVLNDPKIKLPGAWKDALREQLNKAEPDGWSGIVEDYRRLATSAGHKPQVSVSGAPQQVDLPMQVPVREQVNLNPAPDEDAHAWIARLAEPTTTPAAL